jgi:hypothetical protein
MSPADHCVALEHLDLSPVASLTLEEILTSEGLRFEVTCAVVGLFQELRNQLADAEANAGVFPDAEEICDAIDHMDQEDVTKIVAYGLSHLQAVSPAEKPNAGESNIAPT